MTEPMITEMKARAICVLYAELGRTAPDLQHLTHMQAGDLIMALRAEARGETR